MSALDRAVDEGELELAEVKDAYDLLPESIKCTYTREQWMWFSDQEKNNLVTTECEPEAFEDS